MCGYPQTEAERNASDRERLQAALDRCTGLKKDWCEDALTIMAAARKHLDRLPPLDIVKRLRAAKTDDRLSTGALYGEAAEEIERLRKRRNPVNQQQAYKQGQNWAS